MIALTEIQWVLIAALIATHLAACYRVPRWARLTGRSALLWFFITLLFTSLPAAVVHQLDRIRRPHRAPPARSRATGAAPDRCPHCGRRIEPGGAESITGVRTCPHCGLATGADRLT